ncbi:hypothetical protein GN958_ATG02200 [Phytophthora infestans]|uniref:Uncharacterized protein n=1 Tax=Phytophthora infestans TaxID=4787 RepID=A0A8S9V7Q5_PHYIN|nr:hypothetical protein GN958_ATG02200 [Phytophthora infestans]
MKRQLAKLAIYNDSLEWKVLEMVGDFLAGMASTWFGNSRDELIDWTFDKVGALFVTRLRTAITMKQVMTSICYTRKRAHETFHPLTRMDKSLRGGTRDLNNARIVFETFCERVYPAKQKILETSLDMETEDPMSKLQRAVRHQTELAKSDGMLHHKDTVTNQDRKRTAPVEATD